MNFKTARRRVPCVTFDAVFSPPKWTARMKRMHGLTFASVWFSLQAAVSVS